MSKIDIQREVINKFPFLKDFPFSEYSIKFENYDKYDNSNIPIIKFTYDKNKVTMSISIFENDLFFIKKLSDSVSNIDKIFNIIEDSLNSQNILDKRNGNIIAEEWYEDLNDGKSRLSYSTSGEILISLIKSQDQLISIINKINKLELGNGVVGLNKIEYSIILTYYQVHLIYIKMLLGIIISSKISV